MYATCTNRGAYLVQRLLSLDIILRLIKPRVNCPGTPTHSLYLIKLNKPQLSMGETSEGTSC